MMTRDEHLKWAKERALAYLEQGHRMSAVTSMLSDLSQHPETKGIEEKMAPYGISLLVEKAGPSDIRRFIEGFN